MLFVWALALSGLFFIYLEFFLPRAVLAVGGSFLLLMSIFLFHATRPGFLLLTLYLLSLSAAVYAIVRFALWRVRLSARKETVLLTADFEVIESSREMIGKIAKATTDLKPSGQIEIDGQFYSAISESGDIEKGIEVSVTESRGLLLVVSARKVP